MDREAIDFRRSAAMAAPSADQMASPEHRPLDRAADTRASNRPYNRDSRDRNAGQQVAPYPREAANRAVQTVTIQSILKGAREAIIDFDGAAYRLRITRNHRLILTK